MSHCIGHEQCPKCAAKGKDRNNDNLGVYSDGSVYCFSCGYFRSSSNLAYLQTKLKHHKIATRTELALPYDADSRLPRQAQEWLNQYSLTDTEKKLNHLLWSEHWQRLIFPYFVDDSLVAWQGRSFTDTKKKWFSQGNLEKVLYIVGNKGQSTIVLTEDIISAIKVARIPTVCASPIFGSHISTKRILRLSKFYDTIYVWLDKDKEKEATKFSNTIRL